MAGMAREPKSIFEYLNNEGERQYLVPALSGKLDDPRRLLYAKFLDDGDPERAEWLRLEVELHSQAAVEPAKGKRFVELMRAIGCFDWINLLRREQILNCGSDASAAPRVRFAFACPQRWETLSPTEDESARFCEGCKERVYHCEDVREAEKHALAGHCIAVPKNLRGGGVDLDTSHSLGRPDPIGDWARRLFPGED